MNGNFSQKKLKQEENGECVMQWVYVLQLHNFVKNTQRENVRN